MELSEEVIKEIERISHERIQEINENLDEALKYLAELKYPVAPKKFDPTGTINQYHEAKRQGAVFGMKIALTSTELLSKAGYEKKEETDFFNMVKEGLLAFGYSETKAMNTAAFLFGYHKLKSRDPELFKEMYPNQPLPSPPQNK